jgi:predicted dehydrogenase
MPVPLSVAVVTESGGAHLEAYLDALRDAPECGEVAVFDASGEAFPKAKERLGDKLSAVFKDLDRLLAAADPDLALVTVEPIHAPPLIDRLIEADCHILTEKPACLRVEDFAPLVAKAEAAGLHLMFAFANRLLPAVTKMRGLVADGVIGRLYGAEVHFVADQTRLRDENYHRSWYADRGRAGGGHLAWLGIHWLDLLLHLTGRRVTEVGGFAGLVGGQPLRIEDSAALAMRLDNGAFATMTSGYYLDRGYHSHLRLWGSEGWIEYAEHLGKPVESPLRWYQNRTPEAGVQSFASPDELRGYTPWVRSCLRAVTGEAPAPVTGREALDVLKVIHTFYAAAAAGEMRKIPA